MESPKLTLNDLRDAIYEDPVRSGLTRKEAARALGIKIPGQASDVGKIFGPVIERLSWPFFPYRVVEGEASLGQMGEELRNGRGVLFILNHFSKRDVIQGAQLFLRYLAQDTEKTVMPLAKHHFKPAIGKVLEWLNVIAFPIGDYNRAAIRKMARQVSLAERHAFFESLEKDREVYFDNAQEALNHGGLVGLVAQATRESKLRKPEALPVAELFKERKINTKNVSIVCAGIGLARKTNYSDPKVAEYNPLVRFNVRFGQVYNLSEVLKSIENDPELPSIDHWIHMELEDRVPVEYLE